MRTYLKTPDEVIEYLTRDVEATVGRELALSRSASALIDNYLGRSLSIRYYLLDFELNRSLVGYIPRRPIVQLAPVELTTGIQIRPMRQKADGSRQQIGSWADVTDSTDLTAPLYNRRTGRFELGSTSSSADFGRSGISTPDNWQCQIEVYAGYLLDTTLALAAPHGAATIKLDSVVGIVANSTRIQLEDSLAEYLITSVDATTKIVGISPTLPGTLSAGVEITQVVPEDVKLATAAIISDALTYEPNTLRQTSTLAELTDRLSRMNVRSVPPEAEALLAQYRN